MKRIRGEFLNMITFIRSGALARPHSDRYAKSSLITWSAVTAFCVIDIGVTMWFWIRGDPPSWWVAPLLLVTLVFDVTMLRLAVKGIFYRREVRENQARLEAKLRAFYKTLGFEVVREIERREDGLK